jgi:hypothetical protein
MSPARCLTLCLTRCLTLCLRHCLHPGESSPPFRKPWEERRVGGRVRLSAGRGVRRPLWPHDLAPQPCQPGAVPLPICGENLLNPRCFEPGEEELFRQLALTNTAPSLAPTIEDRLAGRAAQLRLWAGNVTDKAQSDRLLSDCIGGPSNIKCRSAHSVLRSEIRHRAGGKG